MYVIGMDFGSDSVRAVLIETEGAEAGREVAGCTSYYARWKEGLYCCPSENRFRQHALDYLESMRTVLKEVISACPDKSRIVAISADATCSTPCLVDSSLVPLCLKPGFGENPDAMFVLWKDHSAMKESDEIDAALRKSPVDYACHSGSAYSPERFWSKVLHLLRRSEEIRDTACGAVELCDWIPAVLTGCNNLGELRASHCAAGTMWFHDPKWGGYPPEEFFAGIDPLLLPILKNMPQDNFTPDHISGHLCPEWAIELGLPVTVVVGVGNIDSHTCSVGAGIADGRTAMSFGTSAGYMSAVPSEKMGDRLIKGVYGQLDGSIIPGYVGLEVGLSAFGDAFAWFRRLLCWPLEKYASPEERERIADMILAGLNEEASGLVPKMDAPLATDHFNGRRTPSINTSLTASLTRLKITSSAAEIYYSIVEATAFATRANLEFLVSGGVDIHELVALGGVAHKSPFAMQMIADVTGYELNVSSEKNAGARGAAIYAATASGLFPDVPSAQKALCLPCCRTYRPNLSVKEIFDARYRRYLATVEFNESDITGEGK